MDIHKLEIVIQLCRLQVQRERERLMTPKLRGVTEAMRKLKSFAEDEGNKLAAKVEQIGPDLQVAFKSSHDVVDGLRRDVQEMVEFVEDVKRSNGGDPLDASDEQSNVVAHPRSSEVAQR